LHTVGDDMFSMIDVRDITPRWDYLGLVKMEFSLSIAPTIHSSHKTLWDDQSRPTDTPQISISSFKSTRSISPITSYTAHHIEISQLHCRRSFGKCPEFNPLSLHSRSWRVRMNMFVRYFLIDIAGIEGFTQICSVHIFESVRRDDDVFFLDQKSVKGNNDHICSQKKIGISTFWDCQNVTNGFWSENDRDDVTSSGRETTQKPQGHLGKSEPIPLAKWSRSCLPLPLWRYLCGSRGFIWLLHSPFQLLVHSSDMIRVI
jgi:hypothetical protein